MGTHNAKLNYQFPMAWGQAAAAKEERHSSEETIVSNTSDKTLSFEYSQSERDDYVCRSRRQNKLCRASAPKPKRRKIDTG